MLLFDVVYAHRARGSHHKIALDALRRLTVQDREAWTKLFLSEAEHYMAGAKAPDDVFKDSMNHVVHVRDRYWGGAPKKAAEWYERLVGLLQGSQWPEAVYAAGVLSHYVCDPHQPLHTAQSEAEGAVHRAFEQSVGKSYATLLKRVEAQGWPASPDTTAPGWIEALVRSGAEGSVAYYEACIDHYDLARGVKDPPAGLDDHLIEVMADALGRAIVAFAAVLDRAFAEAAVAAPKVSVTVEGYLATLDVPVQWVLKKMEDAAERKVVEGMYAEFKATGKVVKTLSADDAMVRAAHAQEVLGTPLATLDRAPARRPGTLHGRPPVPLTLERLSPGLIPVDAEPAIAAAEPAPPPAPEPTPEPTPAAEEVAPGAKRTLQSPVVDAPAIGEALSTRLGGLGIFTIGDLIACDPSDIAVRIGVPWVRPETVKDWQAMARLAVEIDGIGERDAEILVSAGVRDRYALAACDARALQEQLAAFLDTDAGRKITRGRPGPKPEKVEALIEAARTQAA